MRLTKKRKRIFNRALSAFMVACILFSTFSSSITTYATANENSQIEILNNEVSVNSGDAVLSDQKTEDSKEILADDKSAVEEPTDGVDNSDATQKDECSDENCSTEHATIDGEETDSVKEENEDIDKVAVAEDSNLEEKEKVKEDFVVLGVIAPENDINLADPGEEVTLTSKLNRNDVEVSYQWQKIYEESDDNISPDALHDYSAGIPTGYSFVLDDTKEAEYLKKNPKATWPGIEMYLAIVNALDEIGENSNNVSVEWNTKNFALDGYIINAAKVGDKVEIYADKDGQRYVGKLNKDGKWEFGDSEKYTVTWQDIEGATKDEYTFTVKESDYAAFYRCVVTILDEEYKAECLAFLEQQQNTPSEADKEAVQQIYSPSMKVEGVTVGVDEQTAATFSLKKRAMVGSPALSDDIQWVTGLTSSYEYITKETYDRVTKWLEAGKITKTQADRYWTRMTQNGFGGAAKANVLDENGFPVGGEDNTRLYNGFDLTDGMLEINSEWYGKTVYFRVHESGQKWKQTGTAINVPAYTELTKDENGEYIESSSGTRYKKAITILNPYVIDTGAKYKEYLEIGAITTTVSHPKGKGWLLDENRKVTDNHVTVYAVSCETFNNNPQQFMVDAEGNYRMDSVAWGVCTGEEPDISGKSYWALKDYIANGYGFLIGHDTMYAYAGAYYDAFGVDLDESTIDPNDGTTWYYDLNSWMPGTTASTYERDEAGNVVSVKATSETRGGHFYLNELIGSNAGNVNSDTVDPSDAPSGILSTGGSHGIYGKNIMYGGDQLQIVQTGFTAEQAVNNPIYRTPTNYPYKFGVGETFKSSLTHTNQQAAFGTIWANYYGGNILSQSSGAYEDAKIFEIGDAKGTNNFYLSGAGNFLMNQIGHLPSNSATIGEAKLFANSVFYTSQRKQCEICASGQGGHETVHFVHRINSANADEILNVLKDGGNYWYSLDDCYMLTDDISLPEGWEAIKNFSGHWNSDVYDVELNSKGTPLLENTDSPAGKYNETKPTADNPDGWNLGDDRTIGTENVFKTDGSGIRTTGVARVVGDLNDLFETNISYAGYKVKILGEDNLDYIKKDAEFVCTVNPDSKYVISNLPTIYDISNPAAVLKARVYDTKGNEITEYGSIKVKVDVDFWDNDMTTPLYLGSFSVDPVEDGTTYESAEYRFHATSMSDEKPKVEKWQYRQNERSEWVDVQAEEGDFTSIISQTEAGDYHIKSELTLKDINPAWDGYQYRCVFSSDAHGQWSTYDYYLKGKVASLTDNGGTHKIVAKAGAKGSLTVKLWPARTSQGPDKKVYEGDSATFTSQAFVLDGDGKVDYKWQYSTKEWNSATGKYDTVWKDVEGSEEFGNTFEITKNEINHVNDGEDENSGFFTISQEYAEVTGNDGISEFNERAKFYQIDTSLKISKVDMKQSETQFRVHYIAESKYGTKYDVYSNEADDKNWAWVNLSDDFEKSDNLGEKKIDNNSNILLVNPPSLTVKMQEANKYTDSAQYADINDRIGQSMALPNVAATVADGTATYRALVYYLPEQIEPDISWQYRTYKDKSAKIWSGEVAEQIGYKDVKVSVANTPMGTEEIDGKTYNVIESTMAIDNIPLSMYNMEEEIKYFFRCIATSSYETSKEEKEITKVDTRDGYRWGGLTIDYNISIKHNGVLGYGGKNSIAKGIGSEFELTDSLEKIVEATKTSEGAHWKYPNLEIKAPDGQHINTVMVWFDEEYAHSDSDYINYNVTKAKEYGISITEKTDQRIVFISTTENTVEVNDWNEFLREYVWFVTYDDIDYTDLTSVNSSISGGARIKWYADEFRLEGLISGQSKTEYEVVNVDDGITWKDAKTAAEAYSDEYGTTGKLVEINSAEENTIVKKLLGGNVAWIGASNTSGSWKWNSGDALTYTNWTSGEPSSTKDYNYAAMLSDGAWISSVNSPLPPRLELNDIAAGAAGSAPVTGTNTVNLSSESYWDLTGYDNLTLTVENTMKAYYWAASSGSINNLSHKIWLAFADGTTYSLATSASSEISAKTVTVDLSKYTEKQKEKVYLCGNFTYSCSDVTNSAFHGECKATDVVAYNENGTEVNAYVIEYTISSPSKIYEVITSENALAWEEAKISAEAYNPKYGVNGKLVEINSSTENNLVSELLGNNKAWLGGTNTSGSWKWANSQEAFNYTNWGDGAVVTNPYLAMTEDGTWQTFKESSTATKEITMKNLGKGWTQVLMNHTATVTTNLINGHKYYILAKFGDYGDANGYGPLNFDAFGINAYNNWNNTYNHRMSGVDDIYTFKGTSGSYNATAYAAGHDEDRTGNYAVLHYYNIFDITEAFGAGNEPSVEWCRETFYGANRDNATYVGSKTISYTVQDVTDIKKYVVEYDISSLGMNVTNHSAEDHDYIGRNANYDYPEGDKVVSAVISGNEKTYDKTEISPEEFIVMGDAGANRDLFNITYTLRDGDYSGYSTKTVNGSDYQNTDAINAGVYHASVSLTEEAIADGWILDTEGSITECDLHISKRPIDVFSHNNDKIYDGTSNGTITDISIESLTDTRGVIGGDTVNLNKTYASGFYTSDGVKKVIHNSAANSSTGIWEIIRDKNEEDINVLHNDTSDPHHNYYIVNEDYTGAITPRSLYVHSLYQDTDKENNPRNVKTYDGTTDAVVKDILIDNIVDGDDVWVNADSYSGQYEDKEAGEALDENGRPQKDRLNKLVEKKLVLTEKVSLINNEFEDYYIASEEYSGAISREMLTVKVKNWRGIYGTGMKEKPWHDTVSYKAGYKATQGCWLNIDGLVKGDELTLDYDKSGFAVRDVEDSGMIITKSTPVGEYTLSYHGMTEVNYPVLKNYIIDLNDGILSVTPREITIDINDAEKMEGDKNPSFYSTFYMSADDGSLVELGSDEEKAYSKMKLSGDTDTVENSILVRKQGSDKTEKISLVDGISNIGYWTKCKKDSPAVYLDDSDATLYPCDFCEEYHGFELGTDHQKIGGYEVKINTNPETGATLDVVYVTNPLGEQVQNYTLTYLSGSLQVHPELRLQLEATVPLYVCMYGYNGDGEVVEPTEYGITNYSNKDIRISNINVSKDGWVITPNKDDLKEGEMHMKMHDTILKLGDNKPHVPSNWKIGKGDKENNKGTFLNLPLTCHIAGGDVNNTEETFISTVTFTIAEDR